MNYYDHLPSVVRRPSTSLNDLSSVTPGQIFFKLRTEPFVKGGLKKVCVCGGGGGGGGGGGEWEGGRLP